MDLFLKNGLKIRVYIPVLFLLHVACIEQNNPWDPINGCHPDQISEYRRDLTIVINTIRNKSVYYFTDFMVTDSIYQARQQINLSRDSENAIVDDTISAIRTYNTAIEEQNSGCENAAYKQVFPPELRLTGMAAVSNDLLKTIRSRLESDKNSIDSIYLITKQLCSKNELLSPAFINSLDNLYISDLRQFDSLITVIDQYMIWVKNTNQKIQDSHRSIDRENGLITAYNNNISFCKQERFSEPEIIQAFIDSMKAGDTLPLDTGTILLDQFSLRGKGKNNSRIVITGAPAMSTVLVSSNVSVENCINIEFKDITITDTEGQEGIKLLSNNGPIIFTHCLFTGNAAYGLEASGTNNIRLIDCIFINNGISGNDSLQRAGLRLLGGDIEMTNVLIADNKGFGIDVYEARVSITRGTIAGNTLDGIRYIGTQSKGWVNLFSSIVAFNGSYGIYRQPEETTQDITFDALNTNRFYQNHLGPLGGDPTIIAGNEGLYAIADPQFVDTGSGDYHISNESALYGKGIGYQYP